MHKRIREYPPSGGPSVVAEAYYNEQILKDGTRMLDELQWEGVAMVEFKKDNKTGIYNLMEINAKFWGSLDLALVCGANFPQLLINDALGKEIQKWNYKQKRFQWILNGDLFYLFERPWRFCLFIRDLFVSKNDIWLRDIVPNLFQLIYIPVHYYKKWFK
jgi:predicted ATP-grasp superfamily ATP-dependent carboligase